ncbi:hypothetical protein [Streptomyces sp. NPDC048603]|uniref:hypothetical protein n=1 Tax=Streptomyces sp. NPDC048603 TaxID=3365577 RepID=UPI003720B147
MSEIADTPVAAPNPRPAPPAGVQIVHEAYSFACMRCGYGWEQGYEIEHHTDINGRPFIVYTADGQRVPSPLSNPTCHNCGGHVVRIMRSGQVDTVLGTIDRLYHHRIAPGIAGPVPAGANVPRPARAPKKRPAHDSPGPVAVDPAEEEPRRGTLARLLALFRRS